MSNKIIYPILIIIFSALIIYGIINNRNNFILNNNVEKFTNLVPTGATPVPSDTKNNQVVNYFLNESKDILKSSAANNTLFTTEMINGNWTCNTTTVDSNYNITGSQIKISANKPLSSTNYNNTTNNYGTVIYNDQTFTINFLLNENLIAVLLNNAGIPTSVTLHIKFYNNFSKEGQKEINPPFYKPSEFNSVVSLYINNALIIKFASYKIYSNTVGDELYRIITTQDYYLEKAAPVYDYAAYDVIIGKYQLPSNYLTLSFGTTNANVLNTINTKYFGNIKFCIQRVFYSPTNDNTEIITNKSEEILLNAVSNNQIPNNITICPFQSDKTTNGLQSFFRPKATILYFYKFINATTAYDFANPNNFNVPNTSLNIKNNAFNITAPNILFNDLGSVEKVVTNNYTITLVNRYNSNLTDPTNIKFSDLYNLL